MPSFGILSNGTEYIFYRFTPDDKRLVQHYVRAQLEHRITADEASKQVLPVIRHLAYIIKLQMDGMDSLKKPRTE